MSTMKTDEYYLLTCLCAYRRKNKTTTESALQNSRISFGAKSCSLAFPARVTVFIEFWNAFEMKSNRNR